MDARETKDGGPPKSGPTDALLIAAGHAASGLGQAIRGLCSIGAASEALELTRTLGFITKQLGWNIRGATPFDADRYEKSRKGRTTPADGDPD